MTVSVVIPFYNRNELLRRSISSVLAQTRPADEIIVVDDCSSEDIGWLAEAFPMVKVIRLQQNRGPGGGRYYGALAATGTHVATLDMDDFWYPEKLEKQIAFAEKTGDLRGIYSHRQWVEEGDGRSIYPHDGPREGEPICEYLYVRNGLLQSNTFLVERKLYVQLCRISDDYFADDFDLVLEADGHHCRVYFQEDALSLYHSTMDPQRGSLARGEAYHRQFLLRQDHNFTPKARIAFSARVIAPCLIGENRIGGALRIFGQAWAGKVLSPGTILKIMLRCLFPRTYIWLASGYNRLRQRRDTGRRSAAREP